MSTQPLGKLVITDLRGATGNIEITFQAGKRVTILYGENATGKTTICDALDLIGNGTVASLDNRGLGRTVRYWPAIGKELRDIEVRLEDRTGIACTATIGRLGVSVDPITERPVVMVLRRSQLAEIIEAQAASRYNVVRPFVEVAEVEGGERALSELIGELEEDQKTAATRIGENRTRIDDYWSAAGKPEGDSLEWARERVARGDSGRAEAEAIAAVANAYTLIVSAADRWSRALLRARDAQGVSARAAERLEEQRGEAAEAGTLELLAVLDAGRRFLSAHENTAECPLCESAERIADLRVRLESRISKLDALATARNEAQEAAMQAQEAGRNLEAMGRDLAEAGTFLRAAIASPGLPSQFSRPQGACPDQPEAIARWLGEIAPIADEWQAASVAAIDRSQFFESLRMAVLDYDKRFAEQKELDNLVPRLQGAQRVLVEERQSYCNEILATIAERVGVLYESVHPGEGLGRVSLALDPRRRASLPLTTNFGGEEVPPQAYWSQSHLDSLGLCIFLALAELQGPAETILVLDDVLASIDEPHVDRLAAMLYQEAERFRHCIIATHYRPWREKLRWGWLENSECQFVELGQWSSVGGVRILYGLPDIGRLKQLMAEQPGNPQEIASKAGYILEGALDFLTQLYECRLPRRAGARYSLGDLLQGFDRPLRQRIRVEVATTVGGGTTYETVALGEIIDQIAARAQIRNVMGAHFNDLAALLPPGDAMEFATLVLRLVEALTCPVHGWPRNKRSGEYWATSKETRRLRPLLRPE